ncbi:MAG: serine--tRNA ligase [Micavibrio sp.]|nr:serine--tRNA ligase [Micavibrio sp.]
MHDLKMIRDNPEDFDKAMARRGFEAQSPAILALDEERRGVQTELQELQAKRNEESKKIGEIKKSGGDAQEAMDAVAALKTQMGELEEKERTVANSLNQHLAGLPNIMADDVPDGADEDENVEMRNWMPASGEPRIGKNAAKEHYEIGEALKNPDGTGMMDFETAAKLSGSRFVVLNSKLARMERALAQFMLDTQTDKNGYTEVSPPLMVRDETMYGTGQLPKFGEDLFKTTRGDWLIPTSEVPLTNIVAQEIVDEGTLPRRYTAFTPCFRSEAGSAGRDTRGMIRQHQFYKVEMVSITKPEESEAEHERMTGCAESILQALELPYRVVTLCSGDTGFGARKTYDIEVWLPGQNMYREISSCSNCWDFQARRMNARYKPEGEKKTQFLHTLNGSGLAVGRTLIAVMENYYDPEDGGVFVPDVLKPYMGSVEKVVG